VYFLEHMVVKGKERQKGKRRKNDYVVLTLRTVIQ